MKHNVLITSTLFGLLFAPFAHAQLNVPLQGKIPFEFNVGKSTLPAGEYLVRTEIYAPDVLHIQNVNTGAAILLLASPTARSNSKQKPELLFNRYGRTYFLSEVSQGLGENRGIRLNPSKTERLKAHQMAAAPMPHDAEIASVTFHPYGK